MCLNRDRLAKLCFCFGWNKQIQSMCVVDTQQPFLADRLLCTLGIKSFAVCAQKRGLEALELTFGREGSIPSLNTQLNTKVCSTAKLCLIMN